MNSFNILIIYVGLLLGVPFSLQAAMQPLAYIQQAISYKGEQFQAKIPAGFQLELLNGDLDGPRLFSFASNGDIVIGSKSGRVYQLAPPYNKARVLIELGDYPHSIAFRKQEILIARTSGVYHAPYQNGQQRILRRKLKLLAALPGGSGHNSRSIAIGPDARLYASLGLSGNCSNQFIGAEYPFERRRGGILVLDESKGKVQWKGFAAGLRNPVGFAWQPETGDMYASNNGPDHHGYDLPPEYFSRIDAGSFHGMPWFQFNGKDIFADDCIDSKAPLAAAQVVAPVIHFPARNAPMGVTFIPSKSLGSSLQYDAIVALHGSWATQPDGNFWGDNASRRVPKIVLVDFDNGKAQAVYDLISGFQMPDGKRWARPIGVGMGPDGALYFSSDGGIIQGLFRLRKLSD